MRLKTKLKDSLRRRRYRRSLSELFDGGYHVSIARTTEDYLKAFRLVRVGYAYEGYLPGNAPDLRIFDQHVLPESVVLVAKHEGRTVGTMTVTRDSRAGLPLDKDFLEIDALRDEGECLAEIGALAVLQPYQGTGVTTLMIMAGYWVAENIFGATRFVIGVNPRAVAWHRAIYNYRVIGSSREHATLQAPVVGMTHRIEDFRRFQEQKFPRPLSTGSRLDQHFFDTLPASIETPPVRTLEQLNRWKLPRAVFRELFIERTDHLASVDAETRLHLENWRSPLTMDDVPIQELATASAHGGRRLRPLGNN